MFFSFFSTSIIGHIYTLTTFTQGTWDASLRKITITRAFPGKSMVQHNHDHQNALQEAEMDPVCEVVLKSQVESCGLQVVGWYVAPILLLSSLNFQIDCTGRILRPFDYYKNLYVYFETQKLIQTDRMFHS